MKNCFRILKNRTRIQIDDIDELKEIGKPSYDPRMQNLHRIGGIEGFDQQRTSVLPLQFKICIGLRGEIEVY